MVAVKQSAFGKKCRNKKFKKRKVNTISCTIQPVKIRKGDSNVTNIGWLQLPSIIQKYNKYIKTEGYNVLKLFSLFMDPLQPVQ